MPMKSKMRLYPLDECMLAARKFINLGYEVHQQFVCEHCGIKQTMGRENKFYTSGKCEECKQITNIVRNGCNYMLHLHRKKEA
jgi:hypothetical protein